MQTTHLSVFDLDHTLFEGASSLYFGKFLYREGFLTLAQMSSAIWWYCRTKFFGMPLDVLHHKVSPIFIGASFSEVKELVNRFLDEQMQSLLYAPAISCLREAQEAEHMTMILSNSPSPLVAAIAERLGVDESVGTVYGVDSSGCLTGVQASFEGKEKAAVVRETAEKWGIARENMTAYSDSHLDLPLLESVGTAVAVQPTRKLKKICRDRQWQVIP